MRSLSSAIVPASGTLLSDSETRPIAGRRKKERCSSQSQEYSTVCVCVCIREEGEVGGGEGK